MENLEQLANFYANSNQCLVDAGQYTIKSGSRVLNCQGKLDAGGLIFPLEGSAEFTLDGNSYTLKPGIVGHFEPGILLNKEVVGNSSWKYVLIHYAVVNAEEDSCFNRHFTLYTGNSSRLADLLSRLVSRSHEKGGYSALRLKTIFQNLLEETVLSAMRHAYQGEEAIVRHAEQYIKQNFNRPLSISSLPSNTT